MGLKGRLLGICGTDTDIVEHEGYGWPPPGQSRLVIGHESLGEVLEAPEGSGFATDDLVAGIVRRPDPVPCEPCSHNEWDFCRNGQYTERGIKERHGFGAQRWRVEPEFAIKLDSRLGDCGVLMEPASVLAKAWENEKKGRAKAQVGWRGLFSSRVRPALIVGLTLAAIQQFGGINTIIYYAPTIMEETGLNASNSIFYSVAIGVINLIMTVVAIWLVDKKGRR